MKSSAEAVHVVHAVALAGALHEPHVWWQGRQAPLPVASSAKPDGHVVKQRPRWKKRAALLLLQRVQAIAPGASQVAHEASQAAHTPRGVRYSLLAQLG